MTAFSGHWRGHAWPGQFSSSRMKTINKTKIFPLEDTEGEEEGDLVKKFGRNTNIEGINNAGRAKDKTRLALWLTIFVFLVALTLWDLSQLVQDYLSYPVDVSTTLEHENAIDFPSVSVCNRNIVSCSRLKTFLEKCSNIDFCQHRTELQLLLVLGRCDEEEPEEKPPDAAGKALPLRPKEVEVKSSDDIFLRKKQKPKVQIDKDDLQENLKTQNQSKTFISGQTFLLTYLKLNEKEKITIGHNIRDLIVSCTFRGVDCRASLTTTAASIMDYSTNTTKFGNCYTLYTRSQALGKSSLTGPEFGLSLVLNIQQSHYLRGGSSMVSCHRSVQFYCAVLGCGGPGLSAGQGDLPSDGGVRGGPRPRQPHQHLPPDGGDHETQVQRLPGHHLAGQSVRGPTQ